MHLLSNEILIISLQCVTMSSSFLKMHFASPPYSRIGQNNLDEELLEKSDVPHTSSFKQSQCYYLLLCAMLTALAGIAGYLLGSLNHHTECEVVYLTDTVRNGKPSAYQFCQCNLLTCLCQYP